MERLGKLPGAVPAVFSSWQIQFQGITTATIHSRRAARVGSRKISGVRIHSADRHIILQGRNGETAVAGFFTWAAQAATDFARLQESLDDRFVSTWVITPEDGVEYWALIAKFKPFARYSKKGKLFIAIYLPEQVSALMEPGGHPFAKPAAGAPHNHEAALAS